MTKYYTILVFVLIAFSSKAQTTHSVTVAVNQGSDCPIVSGLEDSDLIEISPNPAKSSFSVKSQIEQAQLILMDLNGKRVRQMELRNGEATLDIEDLPRGIYVLQMSNDTLVERIKVSIQ